MRPISDRAEHTAATFQRRAKGTRETTVRLVSTSWVMFTVSEYPIEHQNAHPAPAKRLPRKRVQSKLWVKLLGYPGPETA